MAHPDVIEAVKDRIGSPFNGAAVLGMNEVGEVPADGSAFIQIQYPASNSERLAVGDRQYREEGGVRFVINVERGAGQDTGILLASQIADLFRDATFDGVHCLVPVSPFMDDSSDSGKYFTLALVVPYWFQFTG
jgi:hypothetical protein